MKKAHAKSILAQAILNSARAKMDLACAKMITAHAKNVLAQVKMNFARAKFISAYAKMNKANYIITDYQPIA